MKTRSWLAGAAALACGGVWADGAMAASVARSALDMKAATPVGEPDEVSWFIQASISSERDADPDTRLPLVDAKGRETRIGIGRQGEHVLSLFGGPPLNVSWDAGVAWTEDLKGRDNGWGFAGSAVVKLDGDRPLTPFVSVEPELAFEEGDGDGQPGLTFETGFALQKTFSLGAETKLKVSAEPALQWVESEDRETRSQSELVRLKATVDWKAVKFVAKGVYQETDYDALRAGMTVGREDELATYFLGVNVAKLVKGWAPNSPLRWLEDLEVGGTYAEQESNSTEDGANYVEWRFAASTKFKF